ncbi:uncharacterized histidine-rich protein DDB_G0274557-like [Chenopodium quinoa]|uniref:uncharacterized histidine-rich protein DDB_G0274557-like n=1 Tax=Chenopodium quinoa TaxID=63459 RepID=UPI000B77B1B6|nr:uncharacterized histidine-rich protein DDB_G0274557-like [Chenopodium quinoa]
MMMKTSMFSFLLCFSLFHQVLSDNLIDQQDVNSNSKEAFPLKLNSVNPNLEMTPSPESASGWLHRSLNKKQRYLHGRHHHVYHEEDKASEYFPTKANFYHHHHHRRHHHHHHHKRAHNHLHTPNAQISSETLVKARGPYEDHHSRLHYHVLDPMEAAQFPIQFAVATPHPDESHHGDHLYHHHHHHQHKKPHHKHYS